MASSTISSSDPIEQQASDALASYLDHDHDPQQAISRFTEPIASICKSSDVNESELEQPFQALWNVIIARARATTSDPLLQDRLVTFLSKLKSTSPTSSAGTPHIWGASLWGDLPLFGSSMREKWNAGPEAGINEWINLNAFAARLTASHTADFALYAIWTMRSALETPDFQEAHVKAACAWIQLAGEFLYTSDKTWEKSRQTGDPAVGGPLWKGKSGLCKERWAFWRDRMEDLIGNQKTTEEVKETLGEAVQKMKEIQKE